MQGSARIGTTALETGDGAGISNVDAVEMTFDGDSEILLFDVRMDAPLLWK